MEKEKKKKKKSFKALRIFGKILLGIFIFILLVILFVRSPWGQNIIKDELVSYISNKTNTVVELDKLFITFSGDINMQGLYLEDESGDTLVYSRELEADIPLWPIIRGKGFAIDELDWNGLRANIIRKDSVEGFNFEFLMEALAPTDTTAPATAQDTTQGGQAFSLGEIRLSDIDVVYNDGVLGIDSRYRIGSMETEMEEFDLDNMKFNASDGKITNAIIDYTQTPVPEDPDSEDVPLPFLILTDLELENVRFNYHSTGDGILARLAIEELFLDMPQGNLEDNNFEINNFVLNRSDIFLKLPATQNESPTGEEPAEEASEDFEWPDIQLAIEEINLEDNSIVYLTGDAELNTSEFNPEALELQGLSLNANTIFLRPGEFGADLEQFQFREPGGLNLKQLAFEAGVNDNRINITDLALNLNENRMQGNLDVRYDSFQTFLDSPENSIVEAAIPEFYVDLQDLFLLQPELRENEYMLALSSKPLYGELRAEGTLASLQVSRANVNWGQSTTLTARGSIQNVTDPDRLRFDFPRIRMVSSRGDVGRFVNEDELGVKLPEQFTLTADVSGSPEDIQAVADLNSSAGNIALNGRFSSEERITFGADVEVTELDLGTILQNEQLGNLNLNLTASGDGEDINSLDASMEATVSSFTYNEYPITDLVISGELTDGQGPVNMNYRDENLDLIMNSYVTLDSVSPRINMDLEIGGANLKALGLTQRDIRVAFELDGVFEGNAEEFDLHAEINEGVAVHDDNSYLLGDFDFSARVRPDSTAMDISNQIIDLSLRSNTDPASFAGALQEHFRSYFDTGMETDTIGNPVNLTLNTEIREHPLLDEVFLPDLEEMHTISVNMEFREKDRILNADVDVPYTIYMGNVIDSLSFNMNSDREQMAFNLGFYTIKAGPIKIPETSVQGIVEDNIYSLDFNSFHNDEHLMHIQSEIRRENDTTIVTLDPSEVILNSNLWEIPDSNRILLTEGVTQFRDFILTRNNQRLEVTNERPGVEGEHIAITMNDFRLASILSYLNPETELATGRLNGNLTIEEPHGATGLLADLEITEFNVMEVAMGTLTMEAQPDGSDSYSFDMAIKGGNVDLDLTGGFTATEEGPQWDTELLLNEVQMAVVEGFSQGEITNTSGSFSGRMSLNGTLAEPEYEGNLNFNEAAFTVSMLDAPFVLPSESLTIDNQGIYFEEFNIQDENDNLLTLRGEVLTESMLNPEFDVSFEATDFMLLNSTEEDNDLYYGTAIVDVDGSLNGTLDFPVVDMKLSIDSGTDITYVIPPSEVAIESREGVVIFVNREDPDDILTGSDQEDSYTVSGIEVNTMISIEEGAVFNVVIDEQTGDNFQVRGSGDLNFNIFRNGRTTLSGRYEMSGGHYEMNLYGLVNRRFEIVEGSSITWMGDPLDASLDVSARYRVETSASDLMAAQTAGAEASVRNRFRQELPFLVYLNIDGELMEPVLSFGLDMPEREQGAIGGQVYGRIQQLNQQDQELNKQVFSLLVLNRFYPESISDGSGGGTMALARDNLNRALSDQLNLLSNNLLGDSGLALDFGLDTFTDYQGAAPQERTQLDITAQQTFMDDRLIVRVGSEVDIQGSNPEPGESTPLIGNVSIEYLITEAGKWRIRGFRRNSYENVIEGQVIVSGLALIFTREFNEFRELWKDLGLMDEEDDPADN